MAADPCCTATRFALFTTIAAVPRTIVNASTGRMVERAGWIAFYPPFTASALPGMALLLLLHVAPRNDEQPGREKAISS